MKIFDGDTDLLTPAEAATYFGIQPKTLTRNAKKGKIRAVKTLGGRGHRRFYRGEIEAIRSGRPLSDAQYAALMDRAVSGP